MQAYDDAKKHNATVDKIKSGELSPELAVEKEQSINQELPEKEIAAVVAAPVIMVADPTVLAAQGMATEAQTERPEFLSKILETGPKSLSPKELAAQIEAERANSELNI